MKNPYMIAAAVLCGLAMTTSCTKDEEMNVLSEGALEIFAEGSGAKTAVDGSSVKWVKDDVVWINGTEGVVKKSGDHWYADGTFATGSDFNSFYPAILATASGASNQTDVTATVVFPSRYASSFDGSGNQVLSLPMAARSAGGSHNVMFKHLSAGINVNVRNDIGDILIVDSVSVTSGSVNLCGQASVALGLNTLPVVSATGTGARTVTVYFSTPVALAVGSGKTIQVPVIPNTTSLGNLTVKVYSHTTLESSSIQYLTYTNQKSNTPALDRNAVASLPVSITTDGAEMNSHILGAFFVSTTKKVYFSMGNLQYKKGEIYPWRFASSQYDRMGVNGTWDTTTWVDLFGWGTWTGDKPNPLNPSIHDHDYKWNSEDFVKEAELANASQRCFDWRTLSGDEFAYLVDKRPGEYRFAKAKVHDVEGLILFPDGFSLPKGVTTLVAKNQKKDAFTVNTISANDWTLLERVGCIFLPAAGTREKTTVKEVGLMGGYHSCTFDDSRSNTKDAYDFKLRFADNTDGSKNNEVSPKKSGGTRWGNSVRLVRDVK